MRRVLLHYYSHWLVMIIPSPPEGLEPSPRLEPHDTGCIHDHVVVVFVRNMVYLKYGKNKTKTKNWNSRTLDIITGVFHLFQEFVFSFAPTWHLAEKAAEIQGHFPLMNQDSKYDERDLGKIPPHHRTNYNISACSCSISIYSYICCCWRWSWAG